MHRIRTALTLLTFIFVLMPAVSSPIFVLAQTPTPLTLPNESAFTDPAWARPGYAATAEPFLQKTRYLLTLDVAYEAGKISGQARIFFVNTTPDRLSSAVFRLYPNHPTPAAYGNGYAASKPRMTIQNLQVNGTDAAITVPDKFQTVLEVPFSAPLEPGKGAQIDLTYTVQFAPPSDTLDVREAFPLLSLYDSGVGGRPGSWRTDILTKSLDIVISDTALFAVKLRAPNNAALYTTGAITRTEPQDRNVIYHITTGPVRDYVFVLARGWGFIRAKDAPILIDVRFKGRQDAAEEIARLAAESSAYYEKTFGPYIYSNLTILALVYPSGGEEYPTLLFIDNQRDSAYRRFITAHEVAHQWFYGIAGNDIARHAWLDESLAQVAMYLFYLDMYGSEVAEREWQYILNWADRLDGAARPVDTAVESFASFSEYMVHNYGLGPVALREIGEKMGWERFKAGLASYYETAQLQIGTPAMFAAALKEQAPDLDLTVLFCGKLGVGCPAQ